MASLDLLDFQLANRPIMEDTTRMSEDKDAKKPAKEVPIQSLRESVKPGPEAERVKIDMPWEDGVRKFLQKKPAPKPKKD